MSIESKPPVHGRRNVCHICFTASHWMRVALQHADLVFLLESWKRFLKRHHRQKSCEQARAEKNGCIFQMRVRGIWHIFQPLSRSVKTQESL